VNKLLAYRNFSGIGDWIMGLTVLKMVNQQYPDMEIYLNLTAKNVHKRQKQYKIVSPFIREIIKSFDVKITGVTFFENVKNHMSEFDYVSNLKYHKRDGINYIESMVNSFNHFTGLQLQYNPAVYAQYQGEIKSIINEPYILIQACSKRKNRSKAWKDYGSDNMDIIAAELRKRIKVVQVGGMGTIELKNVSQRFLGVSLEILHGLMSNCLCFIGLDGMLGCYAAHHAVQHFVLYSGKFNFNWTKFPHRAQINGNILSPKQVSATVLNKVFAYA